VIQRWDEMLSLTDMWRAAGGDPQQAPAKWRSLPTAKAFVEHVELTIGKSDDELFQIVRARGDVATRAHWQIGFAYVKNLSPEFHLWCNAGPGTNGRAGERVAAGFSYSKNDQGNAAFLKEYQKLLGH
jgi:hypothetical protein